MSPYCFEDVIYLLRNAGNRLHTLVIPKVEHPGDVWFVDRLLNQLEMDLCLAATISLELLIESARGSLDLRRILADQQRVVTLIFGPGDYAATMGMPPAAFGATDPNYPGDQWHYIRARLATHARALALDAIDGPYAKIDDLEGFKESASRARLLGFGGKWCVHPSQVPIANQVFGSTDEEYEHALQVLAALEEAAKAGHGAVQLHGNVIDEASRRSAMRVIALRRQEKRGADD
jgi:citrate lyase subunit beta/citryl-CoA lyase